MLFVDAVRRTPEIYSAYSVGLRALLSDDRKRISSKNSRNICGSINLDAALRDRYPGDPRWDYGVGIIKNGSTENIFWIEVHPANASEVPNMIRKLLWLKSWLSSNGDLLNAITRKDQPYIWVSSSKVSFQRNHPQAKKLARSGITFPTKYYRF
jgi:hypothetical protein